MNSLATANEEDIETALTTIPRAFGVWFRDLERWVLPSKSVFKRDLPPNWRFEKVDDLVSLVTETIRVKPDEPYNFIGVKWYGEGTFSRESALGREISAKTLTRVIPGAFIYNRLFAWKQSFAVVPSTHEGTVVSSEFPQFLPKDKAVSTEYLYLLFMTQRLTTVVGAASTGSAAVSRNRFKEGEFLSLKIPLPSTKIQKQIVSCWQERKAALDKEDGDLEVAEKRIGSRFLQELGIQMPKHSTNHRCFVLMSSGLNRWDVLSARSNMQEIGSALYPMTTLSKVVMPLKETNRRLTPAEFPDRIFNYIGLENVQSKTGQLVDFSPVQGREVKSASVIFGADTVLYGKLRPYLQKVIIPSEHGLSDGIASSEFVALCSNGAVRPQFLAEYLRSDVVAHQATLSIGARMPRVSTEDLVNFRIPQVDLQIQDEIMQHVQSVRDEIASRRTVLKVRRAQLSHDLEAVLVGEKPVEALL